MGADVPKPSRRAWSRRGVAMMVAMVAVTAAMILTLGFVSAQSMSACISGNVTSRNVARMIAESGLAMAVAYVQNDADWRSDKSEGLWVKDEPFAGGTFDIQGYDGEDIDGDGVIDGDGDLADDSLDMLTLVATGHYQGAKHVVKAVLPPVKKLLMIVSDPSNLTAEDIARLNLTAGWGWKVSLLRGKARTAEFNAAVRNVLVVYFPAQTKLEGDVKDGLKLLALPIITESEELVHDLKIAGGDSKSYSGVDIDVLELTQTVTDDLGFETTQVVTHHITEPFALGRLTICDSPDNLLRLDGGILGTRPLAVRMGTTSEVALAVLEYGAMQTDKKPAKSRRAVLPWGRDASRFSIVSLNANGREILRRSLDWAGSGWRGYLPGIAVWDTVEIKDMGAVDGFNSALGPYGGANINADAAVSTNSLEKDKIKVDGGTMKANVFVAPHADPTVVIKVEHGGLITGSTRPLSLDVPVPTACEPEGLGPAADKTFSFGSHFIFSDSHYKKLTIRGDAKVWVLGDVTILCEGDVKIEDTAELNLAFGGSLTLYTKKDVEIKDSARVNVNTADPSRLQWVVLKEKIEVENSARLYARVQGYDAELNVKDSAHFYGTFVGRKAKVENNGSWHVDTGNSGTVVNMGGGIDLERIGAKPLRWIE